MGKFEIRADIANNRLYVILQDFITDPQAKECADRTISEASKLKSGFDVISDISTAKPATPQGVVELLRGQTFLKDRGLGRVVRVVPPQTTVASLQMARAAREAGYDADKATSIEEAEKMLRRRTKK